MSDVGGGDLLKGLAGVAWLTAGLASGVFAPKGFGFALQAVAGGQFAAVGTVHVEALFEFLDPGHKLLDASLKLGKKLAHGIQSACIEGGLDLGT
jgi:hypothetical protein